MRPPPDSDGIVNDGIVDDVLDETPPITRRDLPPLAAVLKSLPDLTTVVDDRGAILLVSGQISVPAEELAGLSVYDFVPPDRIAIVRNAIEYVLRTGREYSYELEVWRTDMDEDRWYSTNLGPLVVNGRTVGVVLTSRDISGEKYMELENRRLAMAVAHAHDSVLMFDSGRRLLYANPAYTRITHLPVTQVVGRHATELFGGDGVDAAFDVADKRAWRGGTRMRSGEESWVETEGSISAIRDGRGAVAYYVCVQRDITDYRELQRQLEQARKLEAIGQLAAGIAHEISTPTQCVQDSTLFLQQVLDSMGAILKAHAALVRRAREGQFGAPEVAEIERLQNEMTSDFPPEEIPAAITRSIDSVARIAKIVGAMREFARPSRGEKALVDIGEALATTRTISRNAWKYVAEVDIDHDDTLPPVPCLRDEFHQALLNLLVNAAHAIDDRDDDEPGRIELRTRHLGESMELRVSDTGVGIPDEHLDRLFEPFFTTKEVGQGSGQGLAVVYDSIVEKHGGTIRVESQVGEGTTVIITLPLNVQAS